MNTDYMIYLYAIPAILISLGFHEFAHAYVSYKLGDPTARQLGRLTLNPLKHLDPFGTLMLLISMAKGFGFGWAKPVPINPSYYKNHKRGTVLVSLAGPVSNLILAFLFSFPMAYLVMKNGSVPNQIFDSSIMLYGDDFSLQTIIFNISRFFYMINIGLAIFNILPIPPLDGSKILTALLPENQYFHLMRYENYIGMAFLAIMLFASWILSAVLWPFRWAVQSTFMLIVPPLLNIFT
jgi:Zn-dependent protease